MGKHLLYSEISRYQILIDEGLSEHRMMPNGTVQNAVLKPSKWLVFDNHYKTVDDEVFDRLKKLPSYGRDFKEIPTEDDTPINEKEWVDYQGFMKLGFRATDIRSFTNAVSGKAKVRTREHMGKKYYALRDIGGIIEDREKNDIKVPDEE